MDYYATTRIGTFAIGDKVTVPGDIPEKAAEGHIKAGRLVAGGDMPSSAARAAAANTKEKPVMGHYITLGSVGNFKTGSLVKAPDDIKEGNVAILKEHGFIRDAYPCEIPGQQIEKAVVPEPEPEKKAEEAPVPGGVWLCDAEALKSLSVQELKSTLISICEAHGIDPETLAVLKATKRAELIKFLSQDNPK